MLFLISHILNVPVDRSSPIAYRHLLFEFHGANRSDDQISWNVNAIASFDGGTWCVVHVHDEGRRNAAARCGQIRE